MKSYIIAEAGVNHNGSMDLAKKLIDVAKDSGADAVKFQTYKTENLVTTSAKQASYQVKNLGEEMSQYTMLKKLELTFPQFKKLKEYCDQQKIEFLSTPFDFESVDFLVDELQLKTIKISSGDLTNSPFLHYIATKRIAIIISTGMATMEEIHDALSFLAFGLAHPTKEVTVERVKEFYHTEAAKKVLQNYVTVLHCTTEYPAPLKTINLQVMNTLREDLNVPIGYSDHSEGIAVPLAAAALGAVVIEKHFTVDKSLPGPDHVASIAPNELESMITGIRSIQEALGTSVKQPSTIELQNRRAARKSIVSKNRISEGQVITRECLSIKRPGDGMKPIDYWSLVGSRATRNYDIGDLLDE